MLPLQRLMQPKRTGLDFWLCVLIGRFANYAFSDDSCEYVPERPIV